MLMTIVIASPRFLHRYIRRLGIFKFQVVIFILQGISQRAVKYRIDGYCTLQSGEILCDLLRTAMHDFQLYTTNTYKTCFLLVLIAWVVKVQRAK